MHGLESGPLLFVLIDPDKQGAKKAGEMAKIAQKSGAHAIMVGGSTGLTRNTVRNTVIAIKSECSLPVILFPRSAECLVGEADAVFFMSLLNSRNRNKIIGEQVKGAPLVKKLGIEPLPMGYIIVEPGMAVGEVGEAEVIKRENVEEAVAYALAAEYLGMKFVYLEAGSGAPEPVPPDMIKAVGDAVSIPVIVGGGITTPERAKGALDAGADIIVVGTAAEKNIDILRSMASMTSASVYK